ncbi:MAG: PAS domain-containing protein, partial [Bacteroidetes bacterium]|nr:PAS domain-containing protein [Bacteroidota bacterium]
YVTPAFERITGYLVEDLIQKPLLIKTIIHPDDLERFAQHCADEMQNTLEISEMEFRIITQNKEVKKIRHTCQPVYDKNGKFKGIRGSNVELAERKPIEIKENELKFNLQYVVTKEI